MTIPKEITKDHVIEAMNRLDKGIPHPFGPSKLYEVVHNDRKYPPKAAIGIAAELATGKPLPPSAFSGGNGVGQANTTLQRLGFNVVTKGDRDEALDRFIAAFRDLRRDTGPGWTAATIHAAPHKPVLLLAVIDLFETNPDRSHVVSAEELRAPFARYSELVLPSKRFDLQVPFEALRNEPGGWWMLRRPEGDAGHESSPSLKGKAVELPDDLVTLLRDDETRQRLRDALLDGNFSGELHAALNLHRRSALVHERLQKILEEYVTARTSTPFKGTPLREDFEAAAEQLARLPSVRTKPNLKTQPSIGKGNWASVPWIMINDVRETTTAQQGHYIVFLFREDMSGVYLTFNQGVTEGGKEETRKEALARRAEFPELASRFRIDDGIDLRTEGHLAKKYETSTIAYKLYESDNVPDDTEIDADLAILIDVYGRYVKRKAANQAQIEPVADLQSATSSPVGQFGSAAGRLVDAIRQQGFFFEPWQVATYLTAVRTKPFVILAGVTGTGKSRLPALVSLLTGGQHELIPVRPDWTDSSEILGFNNLEGRFQPGRVIQRCKLAQEDPERFHVAIIDEMNLARVEQYFAEVLSRLEERSPGVDGKLQTKKLLSQPLHSSDTHWDLGIPPNLAFVGTVNMDESSHGFSRKVLDRAFTIELSDVDLHKWQTIAEQRRAEFWPADLWRPRATRLPELAHPSPVEKDLIQSAITALTDVNRHLVEAQLQVGYRTRDEVALFLIHASEVIDHFRLDDGTTVDPLDIAIMMKVLPRIIGGSTPIRRAVLGLFGWAIDGTGFEDEEQAAEALERWRIGGRGGHIQDAAYPRTAARLALMWERFAAEGFTSFWL